VNPSQVTKVNTILTFTSTHNSDVKVFLCNSEVGNARITHVNEENLVDAAIKQTFYKPVTFHLHYNLPVPNFYTLILSTYGLDQNIGGHLLIESDQPLLVKEIPAEGYGMKKLLLNGEWGGHTSGGCSNFGMFDKNPAFVFQILDDNVDLQVRLNVVGEISADGASFVTDADKFNFCVNA